MTNEQFLKNLQVPNRKIDVVLDTDAFNEIDDQFAIAYMIKNTERFNIKGITTAPFYNSRSTSFADGMIKSYNEILKLLTLFQKKLSKFRFFARPYSIFCHIHKAPPPVSPFQ